MFDGFDANSPRRMKTFSNDLQSAEFETPAPVMTADNSRLQNLAIEIGGINRYDYPQTSSKEYQH